jgi:hypothetical protein
LSLFLILTLLGLNPTPVLAQEIKPRTVEFSSTTLSLIVNAYGAKWGLSTTSREEMVGTLRCEDHDMDPGARGDNGLARGVAQIRSDFHPDVSDSQADDPFFSINFMASYFARGQQAQWSCWRQLYGRRYTNKGAL